MNRLEMPEAFAGTSVEGEGAVGEKIITLAISAPEIGGDRAGAAEEDAVFGVERKSTPRIGGAALFPGIVGPGVVEGLAGLGDGGKAPDFAAGEKIEGARIARCRRLAFAATASDDDEVFEDGRGGCGPI